MRKWQALVLLHYFAILCWLTLEPVAATLPRQEESLEWKFHRNLYDYRTYGAITLERVYIPPHSVEVNLTVNIQSSSTQCALKNVKIFTNQFGLPVVSRDEEAFPSNVYVQNTHLQNTTVSNNNVTVVLILNNLRHGDLFIMAVMPPPETRIKQQGLGTNCDYFLTAQSKILYFLEEDVQQLQIDSPTEIYLGNMSQILLSFRVPADTVSYTIEIRGCSAGPCPLNVTLLETLSTDMLDKPNVNCVWINGSCKIEMNYPIVEAFSYLLLKKSENISLSISVAVKCTYLDMDYSINDLKSISVHDASETCIFAGDLGRETPAGAEEGSNFYDRFIAWDDDLSPHPTINVKVLDKKMVATRFKLRTSDTGTTLKVYVQIPVALSNHMAHIHLCLSPNRLSDATTCENGASFNITNQRDANKNYVLVPYPQSGFWFISLQGKCYTIDRNTSKEVEIPCTQYPVVNLTVHLSPCIDGGCGLYGICKLYFGADLLYSACNCYSGWRGYGCNDGSKAETASMERMSVYLLTLSNLGFLPGILLAIYRRYYVEALVYSYNMFFSTFYHACDTSDVYQLCIMPYNALSFADFFASLLSFWVTLMAMARIPQGMRSFFHMLSALFISLGEVYDRHGLIEQLLPIVGGVFIVLMSWGYECYKKKSIFPSKNRLLKFILPGVALACSGLVFNLAVETQENYKYIHSLWHLLESGSILFLLPPRRGTKGSSRGLSVQSGDIMRQRLLDTDEPEANIHRADETETGTHFEPSSPPATPGSSRGFQLRKVARKRSQNLVL
ncbi:unnamed protein product [Lymnaea stagnalis]|uniref:EGF-like domain-containing protein n=1 Tax=Lymnaea stagnalis TaxID=6523 RepID=A0AAV2H1D9_LYMST